MPNLDFRGLFEDEPVTPDPTPAKGRPAPAVPDALLAQWMNECADKIGTNYARALTQRAWDAAWAQREEEVRAAERRGADAELEACCMYVIAWQLTAWQELGLPEPTFIRRLLRQWVPLDLISSYIADMRRARRTPAPTLRERALAVLRTAQGVEDGCRVTLSSDDAALVREALEGADG